MAIQTTSPFKAVDDFQQHISEEISQTQTKLDEIATTLDQSQGELSRLTQKKATITTQLQQMQGDGDNKFSRADIREAFNNAMDAQQRLLLMRGQLDKMQEQRDNLQKYLLFLKNTQEYLISNHVEELEKKEQVGGIATLEMLVNVQEAERQRLSRQMHDGPAQALSNFIVQAEIATRLFDVDPSKARDELDRLKISAMGTFQKIRGYISELRPMMLDDLGLVPTLKRYCSTLHEQSGAEINLNILGSERRMQPYLEVFIFRAMQEIIGNSIKHNTDNARKLVVDVNISLETNMVKATIKDNGVGFDVNAVKETGGLGLKLIQDRTELLGGKLEIHSEVEQGTEINLQIPIVEMNGMQK